MSTDVPCLNFFSSSDGTITTERTTLRNGLTWSRSSRARSSWLNGPVRVWASSSFANSFTSSSRLSLDLVLGKSWTKLPGITSPIPDRKLTIKNLAAHDLSCYGFEANVNVFRGLYQRWVSQMNQILWEKKSCFCHLLKLSSLSKN